MPTTVDNTKVQKAFEDLMKLYEENGDLARIKWDTESMTVSEGIGYGMMILVYMDNAANNTKDKFDKLSAYYKKFSDPKGLMNWKINGFSGPTMDGKNSATDADLDIALGLIEAYKQWGDEKYLTDAKSIIDKISKNDVTAAGYLNPGDTWGTSPLKYNPSYFSTAALQVFKQASTFDWDKVINNSYALIKKCQNSATGLVQDWCTLDGGISAGDKDQYSYDATRTPWRMAWAYSWFGHKEAKDICTKIASWISTKTENDASKVVDGYRRDGSEIGKTNNSTFVGPFACAGLVDRAHQGWLDNAYAQLNKLVETRDIYYQQSIKVITLLLLSGNMPDLWTATGASVDELRSADVVPALGKAGMERLSVTMPSAGKLSLSLYTLKGGFAASIVEGSLASGTHRFAIPLSVRSGTYVVRMKTSGRLVTGRATVFR